VGQNATTEEKLSALQQRLVNLEHKVADGLAAIDTKVEEKLARLEARIEHRLSTFENNAELRFDTLEALLRQVAAQTSALPSLYGEVLREHLRTGRPR
jgi:DNA-binding FrmR family transcriptional regulator